MSSSANQFEFILVFSIHRRQYEIIKSSKRTFFIDLLSSQYLQIKNK